MRRHVEAAFAAPAGWLFYLALGSLAALLAVAVDSPVLALGRARAAVVAAAGPLAWLAWICWAVTLTLASAAVVHAVPLAEGSGIPQMKAIMGGTSLAHYLSPRVAGAKLLSLVLALGAGLAIGREGPLVHLASCAAANLWRAPYFEAAIGRFDARRRQALAAAIAAGVTAAFGAPVGGVLFSIETTSTAFLTATFSKCFLAAIVCRCVFDALAVLVGGDAALVSTQLTGGGGLSAEVFAFVALGAICGLLGSAVVWAVNKTRIARKLVMTSTSRRYALVAAVAAIVAALLGSMTGLRAPDRAAINALFAGAGPATGTNVADSALFPSVGSLLAYAAVKLVAMVLSISLPISCGLFIPLFCAGSALGRLFGELLRMALPGAALADAGVYAVVGAAALTSGATQTVSTAVIVFEVTGQTSFLLPVLLATLVAVSVASVWTVSLYDLLLVHAGLPFLPRVAATAQYGRRAFDAMHPAASAAGVGGAGVAAFLTLASTYGDALAIVEAARASEARAGGGTGAGGGAFAASQQEIAVVDDCERMTLLGTVSIARLRSVLLKAAASAAAESGALPSSASGGIGGDGLAAAARSRVAVALLRAWARAHGSSMPQPALAPPAGLLARQIYFFGLDDLHAGALSQQPASTRETMPPDLALAVAVEPAPLAVSEHMPLHRVHLLFALCLFGELMVTSGSGTGRFAGVILKDDLAQPAAANGGAAVGGFVAAGDGLPSSQGPAGAPNAAATALQGIASSARSRAASDAGENAALLRSLPSLVAEASAAAELTSEPVDDDLLETPTGHGAPGAF